MWCFIFFLVPVLSSPLVPLVAGVQTNERRNQNNDNVVNDNSGVDLQHLEDQVVPTTDLGKDPQGLVQNLIRNPTLLSQLAKADPKVVQDIIDLLEGILEESRNLSATLTQDVSDALLVKTAAEASWTTVVNEKADKQAIIDHESEAIERAMALIKTLAAGDFPQHNETGYRLFKMNAVSGFTDNAAGMAKYIAICHDAGYFPVGSGTSTSGCNTNDKYQNEECVEIPDDPQSAVTYVVSREITTLTGWTPVITFGPIPASDYLRRSGGDPQTAVTYIPVCGLNV